jgi:hypothetical protein
VNRTASGGRLAALLVALVAVVLLLAGCSGTDDERRAGKRPAAEPGTTGVLATEDWAVLDGMVSVRVRNEGDRTLQRATALLTAVDEHGVTVASSAAQAAHSDCCTVLDLPPGETYGLYFDASADPAAIDRVVVRYRDVSWDAPGTSARSVVPPAVSVVELTGSPEGAVVVADVTPRGRPIDSATIQAVLADAGGRLLAVVSGRWRCLVPGEVNRIRMQLFHEVPAGTIVAGVKVLPVASSAVELDDDASCPSRPVRSAIR